MLLGITAATGHSGALRGRLGFFLLRVYRNFRSVIVKLVKETLSLLVPLHKLRLGTCCWPCPLTRRLNADDRESSVIVPISNRSKLWMSLIFGTCSIVVVQYEHQDKRTNTERIPAKNSATAYGPSYCSTCNMYYYYR